MSLLSALASLLHKHYIVPLRHPLQHLDLQQTLHTMHLLLIFHPNAVYRLQRRMRFLRAGAALHNAPFLFGMLWIVVWMWVAHAVSFVLWSSHDAAWSGLATVLLLVVGAVFQGVVLWLLFGVLAASLLHVLVTRMLVQSDRHYNSQRLFLTRSNDDQSLEEGLHSTDLPDDDSLAVPDISPPVSDVLNDSAPSLSSVPDSFKAQPLTPAMLWLYCFDVHLTADFGWLMFAYGVQFLTMPLLLKDHFISQMIANAIYALGLLYYFQITFHGLSELSCLNKKKLERLFVGAFGTVVLMWGLTSFVFRWNIVRTILYTFYFKNDVPQ